VIPAWLTALLQMLTEGFKFGSKAIPPDEIRIDKHEEKKEVREQDLNQILLNDDFRYLKRRVEIDTWDYVRNTHPKFDMQTMVLYHKILQARVYQYRYDNAKNVFVPKKIRDWVKENPKK